MKEPGEGCITTIVCAVILLVIVLLYINYDHLDKQKEATIRNMELTEEVRGLDGKTIVEVREYDWLDIGGNHYLEFSFTDGTKLVLTSEEGIWIDRTGLHSYKKLIKEQ